MTIVEFYDHTPIENMVSCLANRPEKIIFVGERRTLEQQREHFYRFLDEIDNFETVLDFRYISRTSLPHILMVLSEIIEENEDCCLDLTGGDDLCLVAAGILSERYKDRGVQMHRYNIRTGKVYDCDMDGRTPSADLPDITVEQCVILHGGAVVTAEQKKTGTVFWDFDEEFVGDLRQMWKLCCQDCGTWNFQTSMLGWFEPLKETSDDPLYLNVNLPNAANVLRHTCKHLNLGGLFPAMERCGLIRILRRDEDYFTLRYKNEQVKKCLTKAGTILELRTYLSAMNALDSDGSYLFTDGMTGVTLDWDGEVHDDDAVETTNEVDVILMRKLIPIFISCKNGAVEEDELYKLNTVADRFGGAYVKKVLVGTTLGREESSRLFFLERARDMGITVIDGVHEMTDDQFDKIIRALAY